MSFASKQVTPQVAYREQLDKRNIKGLEVSQLGLELLSPESTAQLLGFGNFWSIKIPYFGLEGTRTGFDRVRLLYDNSRMKYSQPRASGSHIYFTPQTPWHAYAQNVDVPIIITEGEFKAWAIRKALEEEGLVDMGVIGLAGVTSWGAKGLPLHKDLMRIAWRRKKDFGYTPRRVFILFDYDGKEENGEPNAQVGMAETKLATVLRGLGAEVNLCRVGLFGPGVNQKYAIDDHLHAKGTLGEVLSRPSATLNGTDTLDVKLYEFSTKYAFVNGDVIRLSDGHLFHYAKAKIDAATERFALPTPTPVNPGKTRMVELLDEYKSWKRRIALNDIGMYPRYQGFEITPEGQYNTFKNWEFEPLLGDVSPYLEFCAYFFSDDPEFENYWHDWVANIFQRPWARNYTTPQLISPLEGVGKSYIAEFITDMIGTGRGAGATVVGPDQLFSPYTGFLAGKILVVVNEPSSDRETHSAKLKNLITAPTININNKYGVAYDVDNYINYIFTSNKPFVTTMSGNARREAVYSPLSQDPRKVGAMVSKLSTWAKTEDGYAKVLNWYMTRDIAGFDPKVPAKMTVSKQAAIDASQTDTQVFAKDIWNWVKENLDGEAFITAKQRNLLHEYFAPDEKAPSAQYVNRALLNFCRVDLEMAYLQGVKTKGVMLSKLGGKGVVGEHGIKTKIANRTAEAIMKLFSDEGKWG